MRARRFTATQVTLIVVAVCAAVVSIPIGVRASSTGSPVNVTDPRNASNKARVNSHGQLLVSGSTAISGTPGVKVLNFPPTQTVGGTVNVGNLPATQPVSGTVNVGNFPTNQAVSGDVAVSNFPSTQAVSGTVSVANLPATQSVSGTVNVGNLPTNQTVSGSVAVSNFPTTQAVSGTVNVAATTDQLFGGQMCGAGQLTDKFIDVSGYTTLRVYLINQTANTQGLNVNAFIPAAGGGIGSNSYAVAGGSLGTFEAKTEVVEVAAKTIELTCTGSSTNAVEVGLFARP